VTRRATRIFERRTRWLAGALALLAVAACKGGPLRSAFSPEGFAGAGNGGTAGDGTSPPPSNGGGGTGGAKPPEPGPEGGVGGECDEIPITEPDVTATIQTFFPGPIDVETGPSTPFFFTHVSDSPSSPGPTQYYGSSRDPSYFLRLVANPREVGGTYDQATVTLARSAEGTHPLVIADFKFRITPIATLREAGLGFALLNTSRYPEGPVAPSGSPEEPNFAESLGIGFDTFQDLPFDEGEPNIRQDFANVVSIHYGEVRAQKTVTDVTDLANGLWHHAHVVVRSRDQGSTVSVSITPPSGGPATIFDDFVVPDLVPYEARAWFGARTTEQPHDIADVHVAFMHEGETGFSFRTDRLLAQETQGVVEVVVMREGDVSEPASVSYFSTDLQASAGQDYERVCKRLDFAAGEQQRSIELPIIDDPIEENLFEATRELTGMPVPTAASESFQVTLVSAEPRARVLGPDHAVVTLVDDESAAIQGAWGPLEAAGIVGVHAYLLPTGKVLYADRLGNVALWEDGSPPKLLDSTPPYNLFCNGAAFLADGRLLLCGGHGDPGGSSAHDGHGLVETTAFDPVQETFRLLAPMNDLRWYPTVTTLSDGSALVLSGSTSRNPDLTWVINTLPQVYLPDTDSYRDLVDAFAQPENVEAHGEELYPRVFALPDGMAYKVGSETSSWLLDAKQGGVWTRGPVTKQVRDRDYGGAVLRVFPNTSEIMIVGGGGPPLSGAEVIDARSLPLTSFLEAAPMNTRRRHHDTTVLPDGRILVTGGCSGSGFSDSPVTAAEIFANGFWTVLPQSSAPRCYHSFALLLPDGSVLIGGGGQGAGLKISENTFERYYPDYHFKKRPVIAASPSAVRYGVPFRIETPDTIARVTFSRLAAVTHAFDQNQRYVERPVDSLVDGALTVTVLADGWTPPGDYLLFVVDDMGIPSEGRFVRIGF
jgi:hypothetical protein